MKKVTIEDGYNGGEVEAYELIYNGGTMLGLYLIPNTDPHGCHALQICLNDKHNKKKSMGANMWFNLHKDCNLTELLRAFHVEMPGAFHKGDRVSMVVTGTKSIKLIGTVVYNSFKNPDTVVVEWDNSPPGLVSISTEEVEKLSLI